MKRKGSLNLSIQTIVIVVLAMALLGLGLGFVRNIIGDISGTQETVQEQVREQIVEQLRQSGDKLSFARELNLKKGERETISLGVQNTLSATLYYKVVMEWDEDNSDFAALSIPTTDFELRWDKQCQELRPADGAVFGINSKPPNQGGTYALKARISSYEDETACDADTDGSAGLAYASKLAFISVG